MIGREDELHGEDMSLLLVSNTALVIQSAILEGASTVAQSPCTTFLPSFLLMEKLERHEVVTISGRSKRIGMS